jgi:hypothetical protein
MIAGFTGTREGTTNEQIQALGRWLLQHKPGVIHHGACVGADEEAVRLIKATPQLGATVIAHPPLEPALVSEKAIGLSDGKWRPKTYLERNHDIVDAADVLLACPKAPETQRSGTWATIRYAERLEKKVVLFWPSGSIEVREFVTL